MTVIRREILSVAGTIAVLAMGSDARAQELLTLSDAVATALAKNRDIAIEREAVTQADAGIERAAAAYDPLLRNDVLYRDQQIPVTTVFSGAPAGELAPTLRGVVGSTSWTRLLGSGATLGLAGLLGWNTTNNFLTLITPNWDASAGVEFRQPLFQNRRIDPARRAIRIARVNRERSDASLRRVITETAASVEQAYWTLMAATRDVEIRRASLELAERQRDDVAARIDAKVSPEADIAQPTAEIERRRGDLLAASETRARADRALKLLMLDRADDPLWDRELRPIDPPEMPAQPIDLRAALDRAAKARPELQEADATLARQDVEIAAAEDRLRPQVDLVASYTARGLAGDRNDDVIQIGTLPLVLPDELSGGFGDAVSNLALQRFPDARVGVSVALPLGNRAAKADLAGARSVRRQAESTRHQLLLRIGVEVRNAATALDTTSQRIQAARASREAAGVQLQAEQDRFTAGATTPFFVLTRQNDLATAQLAESTAIATYRRALAEFNRTTGATLDAGGIQFQQASGWQPQPAAVTYEP